MIPASKIAELSDQFTRINHSHITAYLLTAIINNKRYAHIPSRQRSSDLISLLTSLGYTISYDQELESYRVGW